MADQCGFRVTHPPIATPCPWLQRWGSWGEKTISVSRAKRCRYTAAVSTEASHGLATACWGFREQTGRGMTITATAGSKGIKMCQVRFPRRWQTKCSWPLGWGRVTWDIASTRHGTRVCRSKETSIPIRHVKCMLHCGLVLVFSSLYIDYVKNVWKMLKKCREFYQSAFCVVCKCVISIMLRR